MSLGRNTPQDMTDVQTIKHFFPVACQYLPDPEIMHYSRMLSNEYFHTNHHVDMTIVNNLFEDK